MWDIGKQNDMPRPRNKYAVDADSLTSELDRSIYNASEGPAFHLTSADLVGFRSGKNDSSLFL